MDVTVEWHGSGEMDVTVKWHQTIAKRPLPGQQVLGFWDKTGGFKVVKLSSRRTKEGGDIWLDANRADGMLTGPSHWMYIIPPTP